MSDETKIAIMNILLRNYDLMKYSKSFDLKMFIGNEFFELLHKYDVLEEKRDDK